MAPQRRPPPRGSSRHQPPPASSAEALLSEARRVKQAAERKSDGAAKVGALEQTARLFQNALSMSLSLPVQEEALFDLGEVFLELAGSLQTRGLHLAGSPFRNEKKKAQALELHSQASVEATSACRQSFEMYERVCALEGVGELKQEALVNSGNALCEWASLATSIPEDKGGGAAVAAELHKQADERYSRALAVTPEDVELLTNVGDCCVQRAELIHSVLQPSGGPVVSHEAWAPVKEIYEHGLQVYSKACANADTRIGDDLGGLLQNWSAGLLSFAERTPDLQEANEAYRQAQEKLRSAIKFKKTDVTLFIALGESFANQAERFTADPALQQQVLKLLEEAVNAGFSAALTIDSTNVESLLGLGDAHMAAGKLLANSGNLAMANTHWKQSSASFMRASKFLAADTEYKYKLSFEEQCDALYNLACAAALSGQEADAVKALNQLASVDAISTYDLAQDADLECLRSKDWFTALLKANSSSSTMKQ
ncbi:hypothetical protein M758_8G156700 [Ceratodon purpureus]|nr:hypothetical protein M758_8G156700 [Ceratodon purpureus]